MVSDTERLALSNFELELSPKVHFRREERRGEKRDERKRSEYVALYGSIGLRYRDLSY